MNVLRVAALLIFTFGVFAYGALLAYWVREVARDTPPGPEKTPPASYQTVLVAGALWVVSFLWFVTNTLRELILLHPAPQEGWPWTVCLWAGFWLALSFPPLITHIVWTEVRDSRSPLSPRGWGSVVGLMYVIAAGLGVACTLGFTGVIQAIPDRLAGRLASTGITALFIVAAIYSIAILAQYTSARRTERDVQSTRWHIVLFGVMALIFVLVFALDRKNAPVMLAGGILEIVTKSLPLVFMFVGAYFESRFEFFDLFVKRGLSLFVTIGLLVLSFAAMLPILRRYDTSWSAPWVYAIALLPLAMALPWIHTRIGSILDRRWLGRRFSTVEAVKHFLAGLRAATSEEQLVERARAGLTEIFDAPAAVHLGTEPIDTPTAFEVAEEVEIPASSGIAGRLLLGNRANEAPYFSADVALLGSLADVFGSVLDNLRLQLREQEQDRRARDLSLHASRSELKALRAQINPHFLFNALNAIAGLIHRDPEVADRTIEKLADVFRYALRGSEAEWALLDDELEFVRAYLDVEQARFGRRLNADVRLADTARGARVPTMVIQTLVENAVKHGASTVRGEATVSIAARRQGETLLITIEDNGVGFAVPEGSATESGRRQGGYGLANIRRRLEGYFGGTATLRVERDTARGRTIASIEMPFLTHDSRADRPFAGSELPR